MVEETKKKIKIWSSSEHVLDRKKIEHNAVIFVTSIFISQIFYENSKYHRILINI